jgi:hypothetical protein
MMDVLIIAKDKADFDECVATYSGPYARNNKYKHITCRDDLLGLKGPLQVRFWGAWYELPDAPKLEWIAQAITKDYGGADKDARHQRKG